MADAESPPDRPARRDAGQGPGGDEDSGEDSGDGEGDLDWPEGLVAVGGALDPDTLVQAYRSGIFPWSSQPAVTWWSPDPRAIFDLESFRPHRSLRKVIRRHGWTYTVDREFEQVMRACAAPSADRPSTWISEDFVSAYGELHRRGLSHSLEVWEKDELVGGLYGVTIGGFFGGESMFNRRTDASKAAVSFLVEHLRERKFSLLDAQVPTPHLTRLGATAIPRLDYLRRLERAIKQRVKFY
jgi:leucyl/phenylalanyl-tRNA---protein transferase